MKLLKIIPLLLVASFTNAADWVQLGEDDAMKVFVDADSIKYNNRSLDQRAAWTKIQYKKPTGLYAKNEYQMANNVFDCQNGQFKVQGVFAYKSNGQLKQHELTKSGWMMVAPESNFEYILNSVCSYPYI